MKKLVTICMFFSFCLSYSQTESLTDNKYILPKKVFEAEYKPQKHKPYKGKITITNKNTIRYGDKVLTIPDLEENYRRIFTSGLFHPEVIVGNEKVVLKSKAELDTVSQLKRFLYNLARRDSIQIGSLDELKLLNPNPQTKRFVFWLSQKNIMNATECYFELYNAKATDKTSMNEFISGARLTFYHRGSIII
ncbi:MAG: hypothetical protein ACO1N9_10705 [Flavobacterium sp.]